ncbi:MAG: methyltransferase domain-containing protein [Candidatus Eisenbacteria bacterium]|nr:methyltransferase domain-containing protein [Candidatus Eisenbacteria bacterium]
MSAPQKPTDEGYISHISDPLSGGEDKFEIGRYLQAQGGFDILEVGPGGGQALEKSVALSKGLHRDDNYFVLDVEQPILDRLASAPFVKEWGKVQFVRGNALGMPFPNNRFDLINLSAVAHECSSYGGGVEAIRVLASECSRVLKKNGVLLFRDMEGVELHRRQKCRVIGYPARVFAQVFLPRFLDRSFSTTHKPGFYEAAHVSVEVGGVAYPYSDFIAKFAMHDMCEPIAIDAPAGLVREIQRHFLTFMDVFAPESFYDSTDSLDGGSVVLRFDKNSATQGFHAFVAASGARAFPLGPRTCEVSPEGFLAFRRSIQGKFERISVPMEITMGECEAVVFREALVRAGFPFRENPVGHFLLPVGVALCMDCLLVKLRADLAGVDQKLLSWSRREGEEHYFYCDLSSFLVEFIKNSIRVDDLGSGSLSGYTCLVPTESAYIPRRKYIEVLQGQFVVEDGEGVAPIREGKRIIHFSKFPIETGFRKIVDFLYRSSDALDRQRVGELVHGLETHIRDYISRSLDFNVQIQAELHATAFAKDLVELEDSLEEISTSEQVNRLVGKSIVLVGRIATRKEPFRLFLEAHGHRTYNLTDFLLQDIDSARPSRKDLFVAGAKARARFGEDVLAKRVAEAIRKDGGRSFLVLGCRSPSEIAFLKGEFPDAVVVGLYPDTEELCQLLMQRYPDVSRASIEKWIGWNDGRESDGHTNIQMCMELCDILFPDVNRA